MHIFNLKSILYNKIIILISKNKNIINKLIYINIFNLFKKNYYFLVIKKNG